ncbi:hypothetical protein [Pseudotabrizicola alkalilacus]|uniref:Uncharacterized protein n=1 Tax=Pseudotabrizicola alkalilacus TaxID=2305252 RepID=A0A411Z4F7_9RHOB|nr:hypothetical protein [Pseudotabrizicola alkalilacus]RGP37943.1 hypothetical protein D1012_08655 [Pseudotabrizicola alkalilacus]
MAEATQDEKFKVATREVKMRKRVYPRWVVDGRMKQADMDREIRVMEAIAEDYRPQAGLFDGIGNA